MNRISLPVMLAIMGICLCDEAALTIESDILADDIEREADNKSMGMRYKRKTMVRCSVPVLSSIEVAGG